MKKKTKKKINKKKGFISAETFHKIYNLYWDDNYDQPELSRMFDINQGHISRIVNQISIPNQVLLFKKEQIAKKNIVPRKDEAKQAKILREKREKLWSTKLTWKKVENLRNEYFGGGIVQWDLAKKYGIAQSTITQILRGIKWKANK